MSSFESNRCFAEITRSHDQAVAAIKEFINDSGDKSLDSIILIAMSLPAVVHHTRTYNTSVWFWRRVISESIRNYINHDGRDGNPHNATHKINGLKEGE